MSVRQVSDTVWVDDYNHVLINVHKPEQCYGEFCTIHKPSLHSMSGFPQKWRNDRKFMERICPHGIGHPDPDDIIQDRTHGCDGCCSISL